MYNVDPSTGGFAFSNMTKAKNFKESFGTQFEREPADPNNMGSFTDTRANEDDYSDVKV